MRGKTQLAKKIARRLIHEKIQVLMREIDINVRKVIEIFRFIFKYKIIFRSKSVEFAGLREYTPEDDASFIDWNSFAKTHKLYAKVYEEEKDLDIILVLDVSSSMIFGTQNKLKSEYATIVAGTIAHASVEVGHKVGLFLVSDKVVKFIPPMQGSLQYYKIIKEMANPDNWGGKKDFQRAVSEILITHRNPRTAMFFISDFLNLGSGWEDKLKLLSFKYEKFFSVVIRDIRDEILPEGVGLANFVNPFTGEVMTVDVDRIKHEYERQMKMYNSYLEKTIRSSGGKFIHAFTTDNFVKPLVKILSLYG